MRPSRLTRGLGSPRCAGSPLPRAPPPPDLPEASSTRGAAPLASMIQACTGEVGPLDGAPALVTAGHVAAGGLAPQRAAGLCGRGEGGGRRSRSAWAVSVLRAGGLRSPCPRCRRRAGLAVVVGCALPILASRWRRDLWLRGFSACAIVSFLDLTLGGSAAVATGVADLPMCRSSTGRSPCRVLCFTSSTV